MEMPIHSMDQLIPFATAGDLVAKKGQPVASVAPDATVFAAAQRMKESHVGLLVVLDGERLVGVVSERDCVHKVMLEQRPAQSTAVRDIMTARVITATPDQQIPACVTLMHDHSIRHLPVLQGARVLGMLSVRDVMGSLIERHERLLRRFREERLIMLFPDPSSY